jgi:hypothetical protein
MSEPLAFINSRTQSFESLKAELRLTGIARSKFDALNSHIANTAVLAGELVIIGDVTTSSSTHQEAYLMSKARDIHIALLTNQVDADDFFLDNFELLQEVLDYGAIGAGAVSDGWSKYMAAIKATLEEIEQAHENYLRSGSITARDKFYSERARFHQVGEAAGQCCLLRLGIAFPRFDQTNVGDFDQKVHEYWRDCRLCAEGQWRGQGGEVDQAGSLHRYCVGGYLCGSEDQTGMCVGAGG